MYGDNNPNTNQRPVTEVASWFESVSNGVSPEPPSIPKKNRRVLIIIILTVILLLTMGGTVLLSNLSSAGPCLTASDYETLTGTKVDNASLSPTTNFYTATVSFKPMATIYDDTEAQGSTLVKKIAEFHAAHSSSSVILTLKATYMSDESLILTQQRTEAVKESLLSNGVPAAAISMSEPEYLTAEEDIPEDASSVLISITSDEMCK